MAQDKGKILNRRLTIGNNEGIDSNRANFRVGMIPAAAKQSLTDAGAANVTSYYTELTTTGAAAVTLADGTVHGQLKKIQMIVDAGDATLTPASFSDGSTITFADAGDYAVLMWNADTALWHLIESGNAADGATAPAVA